VIAFDSETAGLDTSHAHRKQLGTVRILHGEVNESQSFQPPINAGVPIPPASRTKHGIDDADGASTPVFRVVIQAFDDWCQDSVLVGQASGFDLAMLKRARQLAGME
jgi:DNA polymerase III epsilon subunit-like protein